MRTAAAFLSLIACCEVANAAGLADLNLPDLGTQRSVVLTQMQRLGMTVLEDSEGRLHFKGSPIGWPLATRTLFDFDGEALKQIELTLDTPASDARTRERFLELRESLGRKLGLPWFDRAPDAKLKGASPTKLPPRAHATTWLGRDHKIMLSSTYGAGRALRFVVIGHLPLNQAELSLSTQTEQVAGAASASPWPVALRMATDALLDDFGEQRTLMMGARAKGKPIIVRLRNVGFPDGLAGVDRGMVQQRFDTFVDGHWDLALSTSSDDADLLLDVTVIPTAVEGAATYAMRLEAFVARGKARGEKLYGASQRLR